MMNEIMAWLSNHNPVLCSIAAIIAVGGAVYGVLLFAWRIWQSKKQKKVERERAIISAIWPNKDRS